MKASSRYSLVLSVYPNARGFAFVVFEGQLSPVDWGVKEVRGRQRHARCLLSITALIERYRPAAIILQDMSKTGTRRARRLRDLNDGIENMAEDYAIPIFRYSRARVREAFAPFGPVTKQAIAETIAKHIPVFERYVPPLRKPWRSEDARMGLFDAAALALAFYQDRADEEQRAA